MGAASCCGLAALWVLWVASGGVMITWGILLGQADRTATWVGNVVQDVDACMYVYTFREQNYTCSYRASYVNGPCAYPTRVVVWDKLGGKVHCPYETFKHDHAADACLGTGVAIILLGILVPAYLINCGVCNPRTTPSREVEEVGPVRVMV